MVAQSVYFASIGGMISGSASLEGTVGQARYFLVASFVGGVEREVYLGALDVRRRTLARIRQR